MLPKAGGHQVDDLDHREQVVDRSAGRLEVADSVLDRGVAAVVGMRLGESGRAKSHPLDQPGRAARHRARRLRVTGSPLGSRPVRVSDGPRDSKRYACPVG